MIPARNHWRIPMLGVAALLLLTGCQKVEDTSRVAAGIAKKTVDNSRSYWADLFTVRDYTPQQPQTRYCYQMQSDVVCYDSPQPSQTSRLVGYQDGPTIGWIQPGGGSTGASGGPAVALRAGQHTAVDYQASQTVSAVSVPAQGEISSGNLTPPKP